MVDNFKVKIFILFQRTRHHSDPSSDSTCLPLPVAEDYSTFDIVKATQFGVFERCHEIIEGGYDVNRPDSENVTLLHWAAINNRQEIVKYYISKGAVVDTIGGELLSTPLHWATRHVKSFSSIYFNEKITLFSIVYLASQIYYLIILL